MRGKSWRVRTGIDYHLLASTVLHLTTEEGKKKQVLNGWPLASWADPYMTSFPVSTRESELPVPGMTFKSATCQRTSWKA